MRSTTMLVGLLTIALTAAAAPVDASIYVKMGGVEGESGDDDHKDWIEILSVGEAGEDELTATAIEYGLIAALVVDPDAAANGGNPVQLYTPDTAQASFDSFFDIDFAASVDSSGGRSGDSFFDIAWDIDMDGGDDDGTHEESSSDYEAATPAGTVTVRLTDVPWDQALVA